MTEALLDPEHVDLWVVPRLRESVAAIAVEDEGVLYEEDTGSLHRLNPTATAVVAFLDGETSLEAAAGELAGAFGVDPGVVAGDVLAMVRDLADKGLLTDVTPAAREDGR